MRKTRFIPVTGKHVNGGMGNYAELVLYGCAGRFCLHLFVSGPIPGSSSTCSSEQVLARVQSWLDQPPTRVACSTERLRPVFRQMLKEGQAVANLVTDAHLAALAIEHGCKLASTDSDFARFPKLKWKIPSPERLQNRRSQFLRRQSCHKEWHRIAQDTPT